jgi:hypothetical protein
MDYAWEGGEGTPFPEALARARGFPINRI